MRSLFFSKSRCLPLAMLPVASVLALAGCESTHHNHHHHSSAAAADGRPYNAEQQRFESPQPAPHRSPTGDSTR